ncbi:MAG TPA: cupin domain-containing protein [Longimicrobiales bacterium]
MRGIAFRLAYLPSLGVALGLLAGCASTPEQDMVVLPAPPPGGTYIEDIHDTTVENDDFRRVVATGRHAQLVLMTLRPGEDIGMETHANVDQFIRVERGEGRAILNGQAYPLHDGTVLMVPAGTSHNIINTGGSRLHMYIVYSPPEHPHGTVHRTRAEGAHR